MSNYQLSQTLLLDNLSPFLNPLATESARKGELELEIQFGRDLSGSSSYFGEIGQGMFQKILANMKSYIFIKERSKKETLDINFRTDAHRSLRATIEGRQNIMAFCRGDYTSVYNSTVIEKKKFGGINADNKSYIDTLKSSFGINLNLKQETPFVSHGGASYFYVPIDTGKPSRQVQSNIDQFKDSKKTFRYKQRYSFLLDDGFRFDMTIIKSSQSGFSIKGNPNGQQYIKSDLRYKKTFLEARVLSQPESFEVELEFPTTVEASSHQMIYQKCLQHIDYILRIQQDTTLPTSSLAMNHSRREGEYNVIDQYNELISRHFHKSNKFIGPKPVSFELKHLHGDTSIENNYTVTDKADGEGNILFFSREGNGYLIDSNLRVRGTGLQVPALRNTIINGEYLNYKLIEQQRVPAFRFYAYDIYLYLGEPVIQSPLAITAEEQKSLKKKGPLNCRLDYLHSVQQMIDSTEPHETSLEFKVKRFYFKGDIGTDSSTTIYHLSKICWQTFLEHRSPYIYDGLIYTPMKTHITDSMLGVSWMENLKWKPPHENTIDFLAQIRKDDKHKPMIDSKVVVSDDGVPVSVSYKTLDLYVGGETRFQENACLPVKHQSYGKMKFIPDSPPDENAHYTKVPIQNGKIIAYDDDSVIEDSTIVECSYDIDNKSWIPKRTRFDKTYTYHKHIEIQRKIYYILQQWSKQGRDGAVPIEAITYFKEWRSMDSQLLRWLNQKYKFKKQVPFDFKPHSKKLVDRNGRGMFLNSTIFFWLLYFHDGVHEHRQNPHIAKYCEEMKHLRHNPILKNYLLQNFQSVIRSFNQIPVGIKPGNDIHVANSIWKTIHMPITAEVITTGENIPPLQADQDVYYVVSDGARSSMQRLHNWFKKTYTLLNTRYNQRELTNQYKLIDLACGKGGDLYKWKEMAYQASNKKKGIHVLGLDLIQDNLSNPFNGACKRWNELQEENKEIGKTMTVHFEQHDSSTIIKKISHYQKHSYDVVSVQFALHYFFENPQSLQHFIKNVDQSLKKGGYFVGTCFDGDVIHEELKSKNILEGRQSSNDKLLWSIKKNYTREEENDFEQNQDVEKITGKRIEVFVSSISKSHEEYLVNWNYLVQELAKSGIVPLTQEESVQFGLIKANQTSLYDTSLGIAKFSSLLHEIPNYPGDLEIPTVQKTDIEYGKRLVHDLTEPEKQFSQKNVLFIYKKT